MPVSPESQNTSWLSLSITAQAEINLQAKVREVSVLSPSQISHWPGRFLNLPSLMLDAALGVFPHQNQRWGAFAGIAAVQVGTILRKRCQHIAETGSSRLKRAPEQGPWLMGSKADLGNHSLNPCSAMELGPNCSPPPPSQFSHT